MDERQFDRLALALGRRLSRRGVGALGAAMLGVLGLGRLGVGDAEAQSDCGCVDGFICVDGMCLPDAGAVCTPFCFSRECGDDGCGGSCGVCALGQTCVDGWCQGQCTPNCDGKECGADGCGGSCGVCSSGSVCDGNGFCWSHPLMGT